MHGARVVAKAWSDPAFKQRLLAKQHDQCAPLYHMYANNKSLLNKLCKLKGWPVPVRGGRRRLRHC